MNNEATNSQLTKAHQRFEKAHFRALAEDWKSRIRGHQNDLMSYDDVRQILRAQEMDARPKLEDVPLDKIVGSVGRYRDFNSAFLPRNEALEQRWVQVDAASESLVGLPPAELLKVGDVYFVRDGNHRVSVARADGQETIEAYVIPVETGIPGEARSAEELREWLVEAGRLQFLKRTGLDKFYPDAPIRLTEPGNYQELEEHIAVHRWYMGEQRGENVPYEEAARSWYENVYLPLAEQIEQNGLLEEFPDRTATDMYLWLGRHRQELLEEYGLQLDEAATVSTFASVYSGNLLRRWFKNIRLKLVQLLARLTGREKIILGLPERYKDKTKRIRKSHQNDITGKEKGDA